MDGQHGNLMKQIYFLKEGLITCTLVPRISHNFCGKNTLFLKTS